MVKSKYMTDRETLAGFLRDLDIRLSRQERHTHGRASGSSGGGGTGPPGPPGPPGPSVPSADANNALTVGSDSLLFEYQLAYVVSKATEPTAADYGLASIPFGAVWVQIP